MPGGTIETKSSEKVYSFEDADNAIGSDTVDILKKIGKDILTSDDSSGETLLHKAARCLSGKSVTFLLDSGLSADAVNEDKNTPLHIVVGMSNFRGVYYLDPKGKNIIEALASKMKSLEVKGGIGDKTPFDLAENKKVIEILKAEIKKRANPEMGALDHAANITPELATLKDIMDSNAGGLGSIVGECSGASKERKDWAAEFEKTEAFKAIALAKKESGTRTL